MLKRVAKKRRWRQDNVVTPPSVRKIDWRLTFQATVEGLAAHARRFA